MSVLQKLSFIQLRFLFVIFPLYIKVSFILRQAYIFLNEMVMKILDNSLYGTNRPSLAKLSVLMSVEIFKILLLKQFFRTIVSQFHLMLIPLLIRASFIKFCFK